MRNNKRSKGRRGRKGFSQSLRHVFCNSSTSVDNNITEANLGIIRNRACRVQYVEIQFSTSGTESVTNPKVVQVDLFSPDGKIATTSKPILVTIGSPQKLFLRMPKSIDFGEYEAQFGKVLRITSAANTTQGITFIVNAYTTYKDAVLATPC